MYYFCYSIMPSKKTLQKYDRVDRRYRNRIAKLVVECAKIGKKFERRIMIQDEEFIKLKIKCIRCMKV